MPLWISCLWRRLSHPGIPCCCHNGSICNMSTSVGVHGTLLLVTEVNSFLDVMVMMIVFASLCPFSVSHFCIGQCQLNTARVSIFHYCRPALFPVRPGAGGGNLYKCMRWNVERPSERPEETEGQQGKYTGIGKGDSEDTELWVKCRAEIERVAEGQDRVQY